MINDCHEILPTYLHVWNYHPEMESYIVIMIYYQFVLKMQKNRCNCNLQVVFISDMSVNDLEQIGEVFMLNIQISTSIPAPNQTIDLHIVSASKNNYGEWYDHTTNLKKVLVSQIDTAKFRFKFNISNIKTNECIQIWILWKDKTTICTSKQIGQLRCSTPSIQVWVPALQNSRKDRTRINDNPRFSLISLRSTCQKGSALLLTTCIAVRELVIASSDT